MALQYECWDTLVDCYEVVIGAIVVRVEAIFYTNRDGERIEIDLPAEVARGRVREVEMSAQHLEEVRKMFTPEFRERIDDGELEAIAYLLENPREEIRLVSGDGPAIQAVAMVDDDSRAISTCRSARVLRPDEEPAAPAFSRFHPAEPGGRQYAPDPGPRPSVGEAVEIRRFPTPLLRHRPLQLPRLSAPDAAEITAIQLQIEDNVETHLYLTDYRSLYVGQLGEVTADAVLEEEGEAEHAPSYSIF